MFDRDILKIELSRLEVVRFLADEYEDLIKLVEDILNWNEYDEDSISPAGMLTEVICNRRKEIDNEK